MCGILGGIGDNSFELVSTYINDLDHRGPDMRNVLNLENRIALGATRLAMTDPHPRSHQPMIDSENGNVLVFNGEVYNFIEIRKFLMSKGVRFRTQSDTEVVLKALDVIGNSVISTFEGMFAFAFYNKSQNKLLITRDYLGKKPLYYYADSESFYFSSQTSLIRKITNENELNYNSIYNYLSVGYLLDPQTMFNNISSVGPGEILEVKISKLNAVQRSSFIPKILTNPISRSISQVLDGSIRERTIGHDNFALSMSGGVDSTLIAERSKSLGLHFSAYTFNWPNSDKERYNFDSQSAKKICDQLDIDLKIVQMPSHKQIPLILDKFLTAMDEPNSNPTGLSMMVLYEQIAKDGYRLVLTGDGADEIFGGYERYLIANKYRKFPKIKSNFLKYLMAQNKFNSRLIPKITWPISSSESDESWLFWHTIASKKNIIDLLHYNTTTEIKIEGLVLNDFFQSDSKSVSDLMFRDLKTWLVMESNRKLDRISMWNSIEARSPFQSENVISSGYIEMQKFKFRKVKKEILYETFPQLHNLAINKNKMGFISPLGSWLRSNPELISNTIKELPNYLPISKSQLIRLSKSPETGNYLEFKILWSLIILNSWIRLNKI